MDIAQIEAFLAIARLGSFSRAASQLHRSQPAISRRIGLLEAEVGAPLFERIKKRVQLTDAGRVLRPHAEAVLAAATGGLSAVREQLGKGAGTVTLAIVGTMIDAQLAAAFDAFAGPAGAARLGITTTSSEAVSDMVREGQATIGLRYFLDASADMRCAQIGWESMVVVSAPERLRSADARARHARGTDACWVGFTKAKGMRENFGRLLAERLTAAGFAPSNVMVIDSLSAQKRMVEAGFGLGFLPRSSVERELRDGTLVVVDSTVATKIPIALVHRRDGYLSPAANDLMELLRARWTRGEGMRRRRSR